MGPVTASSSSSPPSLPEQESIELENEIRKLSIKDSPVPLINPSEVDDFLKEMPFPFPERLLTPERGKKLRDYSSIPLSPTNPLFSKLNRTISHFTRGTPSENILSQSFIDYISNVCQTIGKKRWKLLKGNTRVIFYYQGTPTCIEIPQKTGRRIASLNYLGERIKTYSNCAGIVNKVGGVFFKREGEISLIPGRAFASYEFAAQLVGGDSPPSQIVKLYNIYIKSNHRITHLFQASREVFGTNFGEFLQETPDLLAKTVVSQHICPHSFSNGFMVDLLGSPTDGRSDNFILSLPDPSTKLCTLRLIDSDGSFFSFQEHSFHKTVRFVLDSLMSKEIDPKTRKIFENLNIEKFLTEWVFSLVRFNERVYDLLHKKILTDQDFGRLKLPYVISPDYLIFLYKSLRSIQSLLTRAETPITHWEILFQIDSRIYRLYNILSKKYILSTSTDFLFSKKFFKINEHEQRLNLPVREHYLLHPKPKMNQEKQPLFALLQCIDTLAPELSSQKYEQITQHITEIFGSRINRQIEDRFERSPLHLAVFNADFDSVKQLLELGADPFLEDVNGETPLHVAQYLPYGAKATQHFISLLSPILFRDLVRKKNKEGDTPLHLAMWHDNEEVVDLLIGAGANPNNQNALGYTPLHLAAKHGMKNHFLKLLQHNASLDIKCLNGFTPLDIAVRWNSIEIIEALRPFGIHPKPQISIWSDSESTSDDEEGSESIEELDHALNQNLNRSDDEAKLESVSIRMRLAKYHLGMNNTAHGLDHLLSITDILEEMDIEEVRNTLIDTYFQLIKTYHHLKRWRKTIIYSKKYLEISNEEKDDIPFLRYAKILHYLAQAYNALNDYENKILYLEKYLSVFRKRQGDIPTEEYFAIQRAFIRGHQSNKDPITTYKTKQLYVVTNRQPHNEFNAILRYEMGHHCYTIGAYDAATVELIHAESILKSSSVNVRELYLESIFLLLRNITLNKSYQTAFKRHKILQQQGDVSKIKDSNHFLRSIGRFV